MCKGCVRNLFGVAGHLQAITNPQLGHDILGACRIWLNLVTQALDKGAKGMHSLAWRRAPKVCELIQSLAQSGLSAMPGVPAGCTPWGSSEPLDGPS